VAGMSSQKVKRDDQGKWGKPEYKTFLIP